MKSQSQIEQEFKNRLDFDNAIKIFKWIFQLRNSKK